MSMSLQLVVGHRVFTWDSGTRRWRCHGRFIKSPLTPKGERKVLGMYAR